MQSSNVLSIKSCQLKIHIMTPMKQKEREQNLMREAAIIGELNKKKM